MKNSIVIVAGGQGTRLKRKINNLPKSLAPIGNKTILEPGMVFAVDGGASANKFRSQVGDSFIITEDGYEQITHHSKKFEDLILSN